MARLKTYVTEAGFHELAVAAPSMKAALAAWGMRHNAFQQGLARQSDDPAIVQATVAKPGLVLRRLIGSKGTFKEEADLPTVKGRKEPKPAKSHQPDQKKLRAAQAALENGVTNHQGRLRALEEELQAVERRIEQEKTRWKSARTQLQKSLAQAKRP